MRNWLRRLAGFSLVPLSLLPLAAIAPVVAPSVAKRVDVLQGVKTTASTEGSTSTPASVDLLQLPPLASPAQDRRRAERPRHRATRSAR